MPENSKSAWCYSKGGLQYDDQQAIDSMKEFGSFDVHERYDELHDLLGVTSYEVSPGTLSRLARESQQKEDENFAARRVAVVVPQDLVYR